MSKRAIPAHEVFAKLPENERIAGEARGREAVEAYVLSQKLEAGRRKQATAAKVEDALRGPSSMTGRRDD